jgi:hypothetical protein
MGSVEFGWSYLPKLLCGFDPHGRISRQQIWGMLQHVKRRHYQNFVLGGGCVGGGLDYFYAPTQKF